VIRSRFDLMPDCDGSDDADAVGDIPDLPVGIPDDDIGRPVRIVAEVGGGVVDEVSRDEFEPRVAASDVDKFVPWDNVNVEGTGDDPD
jgi:hypothetical protein